MPAAIRSAAVAAQGVLLDGATGLDALGNVQLSDYTVGLDSAGAAVPGMYLNAAGNEIEVPFIRRLAEFGLRGSENTRQTFRGSIGFEGTFSNGFDWDAYYSYGFSDRMQYSGAYNAANMAYAVQAIAGPTGAPVCLDPTAQARNCVPINLFGIDAASELSLIHI